jgi:hypothetical protein
MKISVSFADQKHSGGNIVNLVFFVLIILALFFGLGSIFVLSLLADFYLILSGK